MFKLIQFDKKLFLKIYSEVAKSENLTKLFLFIASYTRIFFAFCYFSGAMYLYIHRIDVLILYIIVPCITYLSTFILRILFKRERPFQTFQSLGLPFKKSFSFPSNHATSAFIIAYAFFLISSYLSIVLIILALISSCSRVLIGIHFPLDIIFSFLVATFFSLLFFLL